MMFGKRPATKADRRARELEKQIADLEAERDTLQRLLAVTEAERDALAEVVARDRKRVKAETAAYTRQAAEHLK